MKAFREWYSDRAGTNPAWALTQAMMTVTRAHPTKPVQPGAPPTEHTATRALPGYRRPNSRLAAASEASRVAIWLAK